MVQIKAKFDKSLTDYLLIRSKKSPTKIFFRILFTFSIKYDKIRIESK